MKTIEQYEINSSRKPITSSLTFRQAVQDFKAAGHSYESANMETDEVLICNYENKYMNCLF